MIETPSPNHGPRPDGVPVDMLVIHYTGMSNAAAALERLCDPAAEVSAHYLVDEDGTVHRLVDEARRAWHAGVSSWRGETDVNGRSIGVELVNPGHEIGYRPFAEAQMSAFTDLALQILARHPIPPRNVVGHSDVAPGRKSDPGEFFDWQGMAAKGIGLWPGEADILEQDPRTLADMLTLIGYDVSETRDVIKAFQRHYRPARVTGRLDPETARRIAELAALVEAPVTS